MASTKQLALKPQDLLVILKMVVHQDKKFTYAELACELGLSASEVHSAVKRGIICRLLTKSPELSVVKFALTEFLTHGVQYVFPYIGGSLTRGIPTTIAGPALSQYFAAEELPYVWPDPNGEVRGMTFEPLYPTATFASKLDQKLYEILTLVDALRGGQAREREISKQLLLGYIS